MLKACLSIIPVHVLINLGNLLIQKIHWNQSLSLALELVKEELT